MLHSQSEGSSLIIKLRLYTVHWKKASFLVLPTVNSLKTVYHHLLLQRSVLKDLGQSNASELTEPICVCIIPGQNFVKVKFKLKAYDTI